MAAGAEDQIQRAKGRVAGGAFAGHQKYAPDSGAELEQAIDDTVVDSEHSPQLRFEWIERGGEANIRPPRPLRSTAWSGAGGRPPA